MPSDLIWPHARSTPNDIDTGSHVWLRVLGTTDVHAHILPHDYPRDTTVQDYGLARTATLIRRARAEARNTVLFDNGDFLQGSVLGDLVAGPDGDWAGPHPVIEAMNRLGYDAVNLGNHEFNFGLDWLVHTLAAARFPVICANALRLDGDGVAPLRPPHVLLPLDLRDDQGRGHVLNLGVLGLLPPQIT
ncbi:MAG: metallophosphoesterase, partial [Roseovarius sp.]